jgi:hypothetical protein
VSNVQTRSSANDSNLKVNNNNAGYQTVTFRNRKFSNVSQSNSAKSNPSKSYAGAVKTTNANSQPSDRHKTDAVLGKRTASEGAVKLGSVSRLNWIFVSRLKPDISKDDINNFLTGNGISGHCCEDVVSRFTSYKSFKIGVSDEDKLKLLDPLFWDEGILVKEYVPRRRNFNNRHFLSVKSG